MFHAHAIHAVIILLFRIIYIQLGRCSLRGVLPFASLLAVGMVQPSFSDKLRVLRVEVTGFSYLTCMSDDIISATK